MRRAKRESKHHLLDFALGVYGACAEKRPKNRASRGGMAWGQEDGLRASESDRGTALSLIEMADQKLYWGAALRAVLAFYILAFYLSSRSLNAWKLLREHTCCSY